MRYLGWKLNRESPADQPLPSDSSRVHLADLFALTAIVAFTISIMGPKLDLLVSPNDQVTVAAKSLWLAGMGVLGMFALAPRPTAYRMAAVTLSLLALVDIVLRVAVPTLWNPVLYKTMDEARYPNFLFLATFAFCSILREAGVVMNSNIFPESTRVDDSPKLPTVSVANGPSAEGR